MTRIEGNHANHLGSGGRLETILCWAVGRQKSTGFFARSLRSKFATSQFIAAGNALKFRGEAAPCVDVRAEQGDSEWLYSVRDNGIGFEPENSQRIFGVFQRLHVQSEFPGTGIGLSICKKIVERHEGRIWAESQPGQGSVFHFALPIKETENASS